MKRLLAILALFLLIPTPVHANDFGFGVGPNPGLDFTQNLGFGVATGVVGGWDGVNTGWAPIGLDYANLGLGSGILAHDSTGVITGMEVASFNHEVFMQDFLAMQQHFVQSQVESSAGHTDTYSSFQERYDAVNAQIEQTRSSMSHFNTPR